MSWRKPRCWRFLLLPVLAVHASKWSFEQGRTVSDDTVLLQRPHARARASSIETDVSLSATSATTSMPNATSDTSTSSSFESNATAPTSTLAPQDFQPPNAIVQATHLGLNFALNQSTEWIAMKIISEPLMPSHTVSLGFGINLGMGSIYGLQPPLIHFSDPRWTEAGLEVSVEILNLSAKGTLQVSAPESQGELHLHFGGQFRLGVSTAVDDGRLVQRVVKLNAERLDLTPTIAISCVHTDVWNSIPCGIISALQGEVPGWLVDSLIFFFESSIEEVLKAIVEYKLNENLASIPHDFPLQLQHQASTCLLLDFKLLGVSDSTDVKSANLQALAINSCKNGEPFPVPGIIPPGQPLANRSMFSLAFSGSVPNSILSVLYGEFYLTHTVYPEDLPSDSPLGLDTNSLALAFYCPWLSTKYAFECPMWSPCGVSATIQSSAMPYVEMKEDFKIHLELSVDFHLLPPNSSSSEFLWRINLTAGATVLPSVVGSNCQQLVKATLESLEVSWIDVTKTQDDSWVATALSINIFLPLLLNGPLKNEINKYLEEGMKLQPMHVGHSTYALANSSITPAVGELILATDILLEEYC